MTIRFPTILAATALATLALAVAPSAPQQGPAPPGALSAAEAAPVSKSRGGGAAGGNVSRAGERLGDLLSGWAVPVLIVIAGCLLIAALAQRNIGTSVGIIVISLVGLIFLLTPESIEGLARGISNLVF